MTDLYRTLNPGERKQQAFEVELEDDSVLEGWILYRGWFKPTTQEMLAAVKEEEE